jgi:2-keto-4-pentenoate hydratase/2-oxohepta-3-ene-1,7-dioic acid hydratase in catechol pathway
MILAKLMTDSGARWAKVCGEKAVLLDGEPYEEVKETAVTLDMAKAKLLAPCDPTKIVCIGRNYNDHATEFGEPLPANPTIFLKPTTAVINPGDAIVYPESSKRVDYECELAFVIRKKAKRVKAENAAEYILGYTCLNDVTARDIQKSDGQWTRGKGFDTFCPIGPVLTDEADPQKGLIVETRLNGVVKQHSTTDKLMWNIPYLLEFITDCMTLLPGDVVTTGTPANIGPMQRGDTVTVFVENIGALTNTVV